MIFLQHQTEEKQTVFTVKDLMGLFGSDTEYLDVVREGYRVVVVQTERGDICICRYMNITTAFCLVRNVE